MNLGQRCFTLGLLSFGLQLNSAAAQSLPAAPSPQQPQATLAQAREQLQAEHFPQATATLRSVLAGQPDNAEAGTLLGYALLRQDQPAQSLDAYTHAARLRTPTARDLRSVAQDYALLNDYADADKWIRQAVALDPQDADAWYSQGRIQYTEQLFAQAVSSFERVLALSPNNVKAANNLGLAYEGMNDAARAEAAYRQAIRWQQALPATRQSEQPLVNLAIVLLHSGRSAEAEPLLRQAEAIAPASGAVHEQMGHLYLEQAKYALAAGELELAVNASPDTAGLHFLLGQAYRKSARPALADREFALATSLTGAAKPK